ncbi:MAM domain-containing glycosylphosphatidylinositol anchor protein 1 [Camponotus japonicus]
MKCPSVILLLFTFFGQCIVCSWQVQIRCPMMRLNNGKIRVRARGRIVRFNCLDGFTLVGNKYSTCVRGQWDTPTPVCVNAECHPPPTPPHSLMAQKLDGSILMFFCEPGYNLIGNADIYCDGVQWNGTVPYCRDAKALAPTKCDFESTDLCWWEQDPQHDFDWKRHNFETPSLHIGTGPTHDHTLGAGNDGHYLYIEASGRLVNDTARIISPLYNSSLTESGCFSFWYHMYGATIGSLNIYFKQEDSASRLMFTKSGNQGNQWFHGIFNLPKTNISFQLVIEGVRGSSYVSDIAIDDIAILQGDECIVKNESTSVTVGDDDQVEIVNAQQTCRDRCVFSSTISTTTLSSDALSHGSFGPESCLCTIDCAERSICCPDYAEYCILGYSTAVTVPDEVTRPSDNRSTAISPVKNSTLTGFSINPKDDIDPGISNSSTTSSTTQRPIVTTKTTVKAQTKSPPRTTTPAKSTRQAETKETPFEPKTTVATKYIEPQDRSDLHEEQNPEKKRRGGIEISETVIAIGATLTVLSVALVITIMVIRRRKTYKRGTSSSALSEDSDVRFLTSDEILDFNLARPTDNDEM